MLSQSQKESMEKQNDTASMMKSSPSQPLTEGMKKKMGNGHMNGDGPSILGEKDGDATKSDPDLREVPSWVRVLMRKQPTLNLMTIGDVSHGKSTMMKALSGADTARSFEEKKRNMTIKLGYTSFKLWKCRNAQRGGCNAKRPRCYFTTPSRVSEEEVCCPLCGVDGGGNDVLLVRHVSFVDCPGHASLMGTMISAACVADGAVMVVDASRPCPGPQTVQHTNAAYLLGVLTDKKEKGGKGQHIYDKLIVAQNKIDLVTPEKACLHFESIRDFLRGYSDELAARTAVIPISAQAKVHADVSMNASRGNLDALADALVHRMAPFSPRLLEGLEREYKGSEEEKGAFLQVNVIRSFDVNLPRSFVCPEDLDELQGGVVGGVVISGVLSVGDEVVIRPGLVTKNKDGSSLAYMPIVSEVTSIRCGTQTLLQAFPGANVGIELNVDPTLTKGDRMTGHVISSSSFSSPSSTGAKPQPQPLVFRKCVVSYHLLEGFEKMPINTGETLRVNVGSHRANAKVLQHKLRVCDGKVRAVMIELSLPICASMGDLVAITRRVKKQWVLSAGGLIHKIKRL